MVQTDNVTMSFVRHKVSRKHPSAEAMHHEMNK